jgi:hypothetical protein
MSRLVVVCVTSLLTLVCLRLSFPLEKDTERICLPYICDLLWGFALWQDDPSKMLSAVCLCL